jgi:hypothetical protein
MAACSSSVGCAPTGPYLRSVESRDPSTRSFLPAGELAEARGCFAATGLRDGRVLVLGGGNAAQSEFFASAEIWDPISRTFGPAGTMHEARYLLQATLLDGGRVLVTGGWTSESNDVRSVHGDPGSRGPSPPRRSLALYVPDRNSSESPIIVIVGSRTRCCRRMEPGTRVATASPKDGRQPRMINSGTLLCPLRDPAAVLSLRRASTVVNVERMCERK